MSTPDRLSARVLLVATCGELASATRELLDGLGHRVVAAAIDLDAAVAAVGEAEVAVIEAFPAGGPQGLAIVDALRRRRPGLPALLLSAFGEDAALRARVAAGDVSLLAVPASAAALERAMRSVLSGAPPSAAREGATAPGSPRRRRWPAVAIGLALAAGLGILLLRPGPPPLPAGPGASATRGGRLDLLVPLGELEAAPRLFAWEAVAEARRYAIEVLAVDESVLWSAETDGTEIPAPAGLSFQPAVRYLWRVRATAADGSLLAASDRAWFLLAGNRPSR